MDYLNELQILGYVTLAMVLGALIGFERELANKPAGMRTHMFVAGAATLLVLLGDLLVASFERNMLNEMIRTDPIRVIEAIVTGVAFLGAGTIIRNNSRTAVEGLTTAAALLFTAGVGISVALKELLLALGATLIALTTLRLVQVMEVRLKRQVQKKS